MNVLIDTHILLWSASNSPKLSTEAVAILEAEDNLLWFSVVNLWEIALRRAKLPPELSFRIGELRKRLLDNGYAELMIEASHVEAVENLPTLHTDPFDRMLIAQAKVENLVLLSADQKMAAYGWPVRPV